MGVLHKLACQPWNTAKCRALPGTEPSLGALVSRHRTRELGNYRGGSTGATDTTGDGAGSAAATTVRLLRYGLSRCGNVGCASNRGGDGSRLCYSKGFLGILGDQYSKGER